MITKLKSVLLSLCLLGTITLNAQTFEGGIWGGINYSQTPSGQSGMSNNNGVVGFQVGANVYYELENHWTFISGLSFVQKGGDQKIEGNYYEEDYPGETSEVLYADLNCRLNYMVVPLKVGYKFTINNHFSLLPQMGIGLAYGLDGGKVRLDIAGEGVYTWKPFAGYSGNKIEIEKFNRFDITANIGLEARIMKHYMLSLSYDHGLRNIQNDAKIKNSTIQLSAGWIF